jgi:hypothetical protein
MGVPNSEVGYTSAITGRGDHAVHKGHVVAVDKKETSLLHVFGFLLAHLQMQVYNFSISLKTWTTAEIVNLSLKTG